MSDLRKKLKKICSNSAFFKLNSSLLFQVQLKFVFFKFNSSLLFQVQLKFAFFKFNSSLLFQVQLKFAFSSSTQFFFFQVQRNMIDPKLFLISITLKKRLF